MAVARRADRNCSMHPYSQCLTSWLYSGAGAPVVDEVRLLAERESWRVGDELGTSLKLRGRLCAVKVSGAVK